MEMVSSKIYWVIETIFKLYGGGEAVKVCKGLGMANLVSRPRERRGGELNGGAKSVGGSGKRETSRRGMMVSSVVATESTVEK
jgi:hypothetical protein